MVTATRLVRASVCLLALALAGCLGGSDSLPPALPLSGAVVSGGTGIANATVSVYVAQASALRPTAETVTDGNGQFVVPIPQGDTGIYYAIARKGPTLELAAVIGASLPANVRIDELSTVAAAYAFAQFFQAGLIAGPPQSLAIAAGMAQNLVTVATGLPSRVLTSSPNADETNAQRLLDTLGNILAACVQDYSGACASLFALTPTQDGIRPATTLQAAINLARNPAANVAAIFALGEVTKPYAPSLTAMQGPNSGDALQQLDAWTLALKFNATGGDASCQFGGPGNLVFDRNGYAWITINTVQGTRNSAACVVVLKPDGSPADGANGTVRSPVTGGGILGGGIGVTVDPAGSLWTGNFGWGNLIPNGSVSEFTPSGAALSPPAGYNGGTFRVQGTVADAQSNIWIASWGNNSVVLFPNGNPASGFPPYTDSNQRPFGVAVARDGSGWVSYQGTSTLSKFTIGSNVLVKQFTVPVGTDGNPKGVALDTQGNAWVVSGKTSVVHAFRPDSSPLVPELTDRGFNGPWGLTVDAKDRVWIANFGGDDNIGTRYSLVELCGVSTASCPPGMKTGDAISPLSGWTLPSAGSPVLLNNGQPLYGSGGPPSYKPLMRLTSAQVDMAGNVWVTNNWKPSTVVDVLGIPMDPGGNPGGDGIVIFVGMAAPTRAPNVGQPLPP